MYAVNLACSASGGDGAPAPVVPAARDDRPLAPMPAANPEPGSAVPPVATATGSVFGSGNEEAPPGMGCQQASRSFTPKIPTVFLVVDRSGSMFSELPTGGNAWNALRGGVLQVIDELQDQVRFGFGAFSGQGTTCPDLPAVAPELNNFAAIRDLYQSLNTSQFKDTPTLLAFREVAAVLRADTSPGDKFILFVTDGEPDYCDDGNQACPPDSVVGLLQGLAAGRAADGTPTVPIRTFVFGVASPLSTISDNVLQAFANAGAGEPVAPLANDPNSIWDQCNRIPGWAAEFALTGKPLQRGQTTGDYSAVGGTATLYRPDPTDQAALVQQIRAALAETKSCAFDLAGDGVEVDVNRPDLGELARVVVNGQAVPYDAVNGWRMLSSTTVELEGTACNNWRALAETSISFDFPCDVIVVQ